MCIRDRHIADRLRHIKQNQITFVQKLISDVLFEGEMESLNKNGKLMDLGLKEVQSRPSQQETYPPHFERYNISQYEPPWGYQYNMHRQFQLANQPGVHATNQPETRLAEMGPPVTTSSLADYITSFSDSNA